MRKGILAGGNWITDQVKITDCFPEQEKLANITEEYCSNGGAAYNLLKALYKLGANFPMEAIGLLGADERGNTIMEECRQMGIDTRQLRQTEAAHTSYTDVMTVKATGKRTFFHQRGANALLDEHRFDFAISGAKIFHLGYLLLLDQLDRTDATGITGAARVLKRASDEGFITSADIVSENSDRFASVIPPALPWLDYLFINEFEAFKLTGITTYKGTSICMEGCWQAAEQVIEMGVRKWAVLHFPEGAVAVSAAGEQVFQPGLQLPAGTISGTVGAGDAFAAGALLGIHEGMAMQESLNYGVCAAAASLFQPTSSEGILPLQACLNLPALYGYRSSFITA
ncbi:carbohydrate kinase family protein [Parafilimonas sp.]|uniref:carbohydrate kinase family protein n=1 Tax=Parafilimonas sp. TaxID=1969739 RepID=UPI0039E23EF8